MLNKTVTISALVVLLSVSAMARGNHGQEGNGHNKKNNQVEVVELNDVQKEGLFLMVEEEKMARDVYRQFSTIWGTKIFSNIANSEQKHMESVEKLANNYDLDLPVTMESEGIYENKVIQSLYNDLLARGSSSLTDALEVGVALEETDITDLENLLEEDNPADIEKTFGNLLGASFNHLNTFNRQLSK
jgi:hypothetical protein